LKSILFEEGDMRPASHDYFDALYDKSDDPWRIAGNWYEERKRNLVAAILPRRRFREALEPGCGGGELTLELGRRCDRILAGDFSQVAVDIARKRWQQEMLSTRSRRTDCVARFACMAVPEQWPVHLGALFDLIVISEFAYFLDGASFQALPGLVAGSLAPDGVLLACHWQRDFDERTQSTEAVHAGLRGIADLHRCARYEDADFVLEVWSRQAQSVAELEGLT
jgi:SAM-dependent methyltransferase